MSQRYPFQTMTLGFGLSSLSPYCDPDTLYLHHGQYYAQKVRELNHLVSKHRFTNLSLEELLTQDINRPAIQLARLKGAAGAVYNHELYFDGIQSVINTPPLNKLTGVLIGVYGSMNAFKRLLLEAADSLPGAGWVWLVAERSCGPHIVITDNNETVDLRSVQPIFVADLWEHAYFLDDQFDKEKYLDYWFSFIDWKKAETRFEQSRASAAC